MKRRGSLFRRGPRPGPGPFDRRASPRYPVVQDRALLGWWVGTETRRCPVRLLNISSGGVLIFTRESPKRRQTAWICLEDPATEWVEAHVVSIVKIPGLLWFRRASYLVRLRFTKPCPYSFFRSATHGHQLDATGPKAIAPELLDNHYWR